MPKPKVLVVDDSNFTLAVIRDNLVAAGYEVVTRDQSIGAGVAILKQQPDLVLLDVVMPTLGGQDVVALVRKNPALSRTKIVLFSELSDDALAAMAKECGADGYVRKSRKPDEIVAQIGKYLASTPLPPRANPPPVNINDVVLFVDSERKLRDYRQAFSHLPSTVYLSSGTAALAMLTSGAPPTWVVTGLDLDDMGGDELLRRATKHDARWRSHFVFFTEPGERLPDDLRTAPSPPVLQHPVEALNLQLILAGRT